MRKKVTSLIILIFSLFCLVSCSFNPFTTHHNETGSPAGIVAGAAIGAGSVGLLGAPKSVMVLAGLTGGAVGYYVTTLRYAASGVMWAGGEVYQEGDYLGIYIPTDNLFEANTADFLPKAPFILDSAVSVLQRKPKNNILISGNTSGFSEVSWERKLSLRRARQVAFYLWNAGIDEFQEADIASHRLRYVGYGDYLPIASTLTNNGIRENSRIQITSYPATASLYPANVGLMKDQVGAGGNCTKYSDRSRRQ
jgi:hypothetical protein